MPISADLVPISTNFMQISADLVPSWLGLAWPGLAWRGLAWPGLAWPSVASLAAWLASNSMKIPIRVVAGLMWGRAVCIGKIEYKKNRFWRPLVGEMEI